MPGFTEEQIARRAQLRAQLDHLEPELRDIQEERKDLERQERELIRTINGAEDVSLRV